MAMKTAELTTTTPVTEGLKPERLSLIDTAWLHMESPTNLMVVGSVAFFDEPIDREQLLSTLKVRLLQHPRFSERIQDSPVGPPRWVVDRSFDVGAHVHRVALPAPGGDAELRVLLGDLMSRPLDMTRPLWDAHLIENHRGGGVLFTRIHHCIADGTALIHVLVGLTATTPAASLRAAPPQTPKAHANGHHRLPGLVDPRRTVGTLVQAGAQAYTLAKLVALWPDPATPLRGGLVRAKNVAWSEPFPLEALRPIREATGFTVNDVVLTAVTGALRTHIRKHGNGDVPEHIRGLVPVDLRADPINGTLGNQFGLVFLDMPVGIARRRDRLEAVHARMGAAKQSPQSALVMEVLGAMGLTPQSVQRQAVRFFGSKGSAVVTNVRGPAEQLYLAGRKLRSLAFFVPQSAMLGIGISIMTYGGQIQVGVIADSGLVPEPLQITKDITSELRQLSKI